MARKERAESDPMSAEGQEVKSRRERLGLNKSEFASKAEVSRDTVHDIEAGKGFQAATLVKMRAALDRLEAEAGIDAPSPQDRGAAVIEFEVTDTAGVRVVLRGPISDAAELERTVAQLVRDIRGDAE